MCAPVGYATDHGEWRHRADGGWYSDGGRQRRRAPSVRVSRRLRRILPHLDRQPGAVAAHARHLFGVGKSAPRAVLLRQHVGSRRTVRVSRLADQRVEGAVDRVRAAGRIRRCEPAEPIHATGCCRADTDRHAMDSRQHVAVSSALFRLEQRRLPLHRHVARRLQVLPVHVPAADTDVRRVVSVRPLSAALVRAGRPPIRRPPVRIPRCAVRLLFRVFPRLGVRHRRLHRHRPRDRVHRLEAGR